MGERTRDDRRDTRLGTSITTQSNRREALRGLGALTGLAFVGGSTGLLAGCGSGGGGGDPPAKPGVAAHRLAFNIQGVALDPISTGQMNTEATGSTILVSIGRGVIGQHVLPTDNKGNTYALLDGPHNYGVQWPTSGVALYAATSAIGGNLHVVSTTNPNFDEITLAVVEIKNGGVIKDLKHNYVLSFPSAPGTPLTSQSVTTTGPATLVAFWWGDGVINQHTAVPDSGFTVVDSVFDNAAIVQCAVAVKNVSAAGQYSVTWTATPDQGAQLYLVAIQKA